MADTPASPLPVRQVICPTCNGPSLYGPDNPYRPFCSKRCKHIDLGAWAAEDFRVPDTGPDTTPAHEGDQSS